MTVVPENKISVQSCEERIMIRSGSPLIILGAGKKKLKFTNLGRECSVKLQLRSISIGLIHADGLI